MPRSFRGEHTIKFSATIAATLAGAAVFAASPAYAAEVDPPLQIFTGTQSNGQFPDLNGADFDGLVQQGGQFFAIARGQGTNSGSTAKCTKDGNNWTGRDSCITRYDWTTGEWVVDGLTQPKWGSYSDWRDQPRDLGSIATDGTNLVLTMTPVNGDEFQRDFVFYSPDNGATWTPGQDLPFGTKLFSGDGFIAAGNFASPSGYPTVSVDGGKTWVTTDTITSNAVKGPAEAKLTGVGTPGDCGTQWAWSPDPVNNISTLTTSNDEFTHRGGPYSMNSTTFSVANLGTDTYVIGDNGAWAYFWDGCNPDGRRPISGGGSNQTLLAAPDFPGVYNVENGFFYQRIGAERSPSIKYFGQVKGLATYGSTMMYLNSGRQHYFISANLPPMGWDPTTDKDAGVGNPILNPDKDAGVGNDFPDLPPLVPPPDVPAVIDGDNSVVMPDLGVTPKNEDGQPVMAGASPWKPNATGWCEWRGSKVACVSEMDPLPEADNLYTLKANLSGTSVSRKGACRWTTTKPQCRVWLTQPGKWRLTWSGSNAGKTVSGQRTVIVK